MNTLLVPSITSVSINPNPVNQNVAFLIAISVTEIEKELEPIVLYSGTFYSGEEVIL